MKKFTIIIAALALVCFAAPAMAVDWNFYGNARMATYWDSNDYKDSALRAGTRVGTDEAELTWDLQGNSRIGANIKAESIKAQFEFGVNESTVTSRRLYGVWNFGAGTLKVGKDYTPVSQFISGQAIDGDIGLLGIGTVYGSRVGQVALGFGGFEIALISPSTGQLSAAGSNFLQTALINQLQASIAEAIASGNTVAFATNNFALQVAQSLENAGATTGDVDQVIPKIEAKWGMAFDTWNFNLRGGYNYYTIQDQPVATGTDDLKISSWILAADGGWNFGPGYLKGAISYGVNVGNAGWNIPGLYTTSGGNATWGGGDDVDDNESFMGALVAGLKVSDMLSFEGGIGYRSDDPTDAPTGFDEKQSVYSVYVQSVIALAPGVYIIPEVGYFDYDDDFTGADAGSRLYLGGKWQINF
jgi:hypothetical protein